MNPRTLRVMLAATAFAAVTSMPLAGLAQTPLQDADPACGTEAGSGGVRPEDGVLTIATYNILHTQPDLADRALDTRLEAIADTLAASGADIVGMQEVVESANHGNVAQRVAAGLAERTGVAWTWCWYASNPHCPGEPDSEPGGRGGPCSAGIAGQARSGDSPWREGVAILTPYEVTAVNAHRLVGRQQEIPLCSVEQTTNPFCAPTLTVDTRTIVYARVQTPFGAVDAATSHLANTETSLSEVTRELQANDALFHLDGLVADDGTPDVWVGDYNTHEGGRVWQTIVDAGFLDGYREAEPTAEGFSSGQEIDAPSGTVDGRIDYVFTRPGSCPTAFAAAQMLGDAPVPFEGATVWPSDHWGVAVTLELAGECAVAPDAAPEPSPPPPPAPAPEPSLPVTGGGAPALAAAVTAAAAAVWRRRLASRI